MIDRPTRSLSGRGTQPGDSWKALTNDGAGVIELAGVCLDNPRGGAQLVAGVDLELAGGEIALVVAAAGSGTSRLVAAVVGEAPYSGRIEVLGRDVAKLRRSSLRQLRRKIGVVPQDLCLLEDRTAHQNVALPLEIDGISRSEAAIKATEILVRLGLEGEAFLPVSRLPASARQRVAVGRALVREPDLVLADHPTSLQDAAGAELVCEALGDAAGAGACVVAFAYDSMIRTIAQRCGWRQVAFVEGQFVPLYNGFDDALFMSRGSAPELMPNNDAVPNIVPFSLSANTTGVA